MTIGIVIAIERELQAFLANGREVRTQQIGTRSVYVSEIDGKTVYAVLSGYGEIDAAAATQLLITGCGCDVILNFGVTGALRREFEVSDLFVVSAAINYDFDTSAIDPVKPHQYSEFPDEKIPLDAELLALARKIRPDLLEAVVASGERFIEKKEEKITLRDLGCDICDMEIAAIARTAFLSGARVLSVKCISDTFDGGFNDFIANVTASAEKAFSILLEILHRIDEISEM